MKDLWKIQTSTILEKYWDNVIYHLELSHKPNILASTWQVMSYFLSWAHAFLCPAKFGFSTTFLPPKLGGEVAVKPNSFSCSPYKASFFVLIGKNYGTKLSSFRRH